MTVMAFALIALAVIVMVAVHFRTRTRLEQRYDGLLKEIAGRTEGRDLALQKQAKVYARQAEMTRRAAAKAVDQSRDLQADTRQLHQIMEGFVRELHERGWQIDGR